MPNLTKTEFTWVCAYARVSGIPVDDLAGHYPHCFTCRNCGFSWVGLLSPTLTIGQMHKIYCPGCLHNEDGPYVPPPVPFTIF